MSKLKTFLRRVVLEPVKRISKEREFEQKLKRATPIIVYQMGKVGSSSVYQSLRKQHPGVVQHAHSFSAAHNEPEIRRLYRWAITDGLPLHVISLTREPIGRNVSAFFQNFERDTGVPYSKANFSMEELKAIFLKNYRHDIPLQWFDNNIAANFGIDVFATPFPESGCATYSRNNVRLLILRSELSDEEKVTAIREFLGMPGFQLQNTNIGEQKDYAATYKAFRREVKLPSALVERMCASKYFNHFYNKDVIELVRSKWCE